MKAIKNLVYRWGRDGTVTTTTVAPTTTTAAPTTTAPTTTTVAPTTTTTVAPDVTAPSIPQNTRFENADFGIY